MMMMQVGIRVVFDQGVPWFEVRIINEMNKPREWREMSINLG